MYTKVTLFGSERQIKTFRVQTEDGLICVLYMNLVFRFPQSILVFYYNKKVRKRFTLLRQLQQLVNNKIITIIMKEKKSKKSINLDSPKETKTFQRNSKEQIIVDIWGIRDCHLGTHDSWRQGKHKGDLIYQLNTRLSVPSADVIPVYSVLECSPWQQKDAGIDHQFENCKLSFSSSVVFQTRSFYFSGEKILILSAFFYLRGNKKQWKSVLNIAENAN